MHRTHFKSSLELESLHFVLLLACLPHCFVPLPWNEDPIVLASDHRLELSLEMLIILFSANRSSGQPVLVNRLKGCHFCLPISANLLCVFVYSEAVLYILAKEREVIAESGLLNCDLPFILFS